MKTYPLTKNVKLTLLAAATFGTGLTFIPSETLAGQGPQPSICNRSCWSARAACGAHTQMSALTRAIVHHTAGSSDWTTDYESGKSKVRGVQNIHMDGNGWCDIGYHFLVNAGGHIYEGRAGSMSSLPRGSHDCANGNSFGFTVLGYYHPPYNHTFTTASQNAVMDVIAWRMPSAWSPYGSGSYSTCEGTKTVGFLDGHNKVVGTACPGSTIYDGYITDNRNGGALRDGVNARKNGTPPPSSLASPLISVGAQASGALQVFYRGSNGGIWTRAQTSANGGWGAEFTLGGIITSRPTVGKNQNGTLQVFYRGTDAAVWSRAQNIDGSWGPETRLGGATTSIIVPVSNADGRQEVFYRGNDNGIWHRWQNAPNGSWSSVDAGRGGQWAGAPAVGHNADGRLELFARGTDNALYHTWQTSAGGGWGPWYYLGGVLTSDPVVASNADGRLQVFYRGGDNALWSRWQTSPSGNWSGEQSLGGSLTSLMAVGRNYDGHLEVFVRTTDNSIRQIWQTSPNGAFGSWAVMPANITSAVSVGSNQDGRLQVFFRGVDNALWSRWQTSPGGSWSGEQQFPCTIANAQYE